jgi:hypothetical protein
MTEIPAQPQPDRKPAGDDRDARLAAALRANLARRKAQQRARATTTTAAAAADAPRDMG